MRGLEHGWQPSTGKSEVAGADVKRVLPASAYDRRWPACTTPSGTVQFWQRQKSQRADRTGWLPWRDSNRSASISNRSAGVICKLTSHANISETVRTIFRRYLDLGAMGAVIEDLDQRGIRTNV